jgi:hypothetical protein
MALQINKVISANTSTANKIFFIFIVLLLFDDVKVITCTRGIRTPIGQKRTNKELTSDNSNPYNIIAALKEQLFDVTL